MSISRLRALLIPAFAAAVAACSAETSPDEGAGAASAENANTTEPTVGTPGSHVSVHGMVLFGSEKLYLSHIPLFGNPHNIQVVVEAKIVAGSVPSTAAFANQLYTVRPRPFSLSDLANGTLRTITGTVYLGNFESGGTPAFQNVTFEVSRTVFRRGLVQQTPKSPTLDYIAVGTPTEPYLVHILDAPSAWDHIVKVQLPEDSWLDAAALEAGTIVSIEGGVNSMQTRLRANSTIEANKLSSEPATDAGPAPDAAPPVTDAGPAPDPAPDATPPVTDAGPAPDASADENVCTSNADCAAPAACVGGKCESETKLPPPPPQPGTNKSITVVGERSCLRGPDYFQPCPP
jgi:hypothetical protein